VREGHSLLEVDGRRTAYLLIGARPAWRALGPSTSDGEDVRQLERALRRLGADPDHAMTVDDHWSQNTTAAVKRFQHERDLPEDGALAPGEIVFWPTTARVGEVKVERGERLRPGAPLATLSSTRRIVRVDLDADRQALAHTGDAVTVEMPDGSTVRGVIASVGKVATAPAEEGGSPTIEVQVRLRGRRARGVGLDQAPVEVGFERERARRVLHVPVTALLARAGGGYAVQVVGSDGALQTVPVELGLEASGEVAVSGAGLRAGQRVVVAQ
jgi:multidrug efflux pump subunit AcrA (membrane-fusion protein)